MRSGSSTEAQQIPGLHLARGLQRLARRGGCGPGRRTVLASIESGSLAGPDNLISAKSGLLLRASASTTRVIKVL
jgi:hypothetical protein